MDRADHDIFSLTPPPYLLSIFTVFKAIWKAIPSVQMNQEQLRTLASCIAELLQTLDQQYRTGKLQENNTSEILDDLDKLLHEISSFFRKEAGSEFLRLLITKDQKIAQIEGYYHKIGSFMHTFQISECINDEELPSRFQNAKATDQFLLDVKLSDLEENPDRLVEILSPRGGDTTPIMVCLQRRLDGPWDGNRERQFFRHAQRYLASCSDNQVDIKSWMITSYEVDFGPRIGVGGFGEVFKGTWNKIQVAIKVLKTNSGLTPSPAGIRREIKTWSSLRYAHILQFLGANEWGDKPFIVMPYLKNGNARDFIMAYPRCNRLRIIHHSALGLLYLHSQKIVHGDLKALNILIDDAENAVLCDFGLSRIKADAASHSVRLDDGDIIGSRNWMAPERLLKGVLGQPGDIYALGMTIYEIFMNEIPLGDINYGDFIDLVANGDVRPERPEEEDTPNFPDGVWKLAEACWVKEPKRRPNANDVCNTISKLLEGNPVTTPRRATAFETTATPVPPILTPSSPTIRSNLKLVVECYSSATPLVQTPVTEESPEAGQKQEQNPPSVSPGRQSLPPEPAAVVSASRLKLISTLTMSQPSVVYCIAFSHHGNRIVSGSQYGSICIWDAQTGDVVAKSQRLHNGPVFCVTFSPDGRQVASGSTDKTIAVWDVQTVNLTKQMVSGHNRSVTCINFSPDSRRIVSGSADHTILLWDVQMGTIAAGPCKGHADCVAQVVFTPDGKQIISGSEDKTVRIWDAGTGGLVRLLLGGHDYPISFVGVSPDGSKVVSGSRDKLFCVWDIQTGVLISGPSKRHQKGLLAVMSSQSVGGNSGITVSPDGQWIAMESTGVHVWGSEIGSPDLAIQGIDHVWCIAFSPNSRRVAFCPCRASFRVCTFDYM